MNENVNGDDLSYFFLYARSDHLNKYLNKYRTPPPPLPMNYRTRNSDSGLNWTVDCPEKKMWHFFLQNFFVSVVWFDAYFELRFFFCGSILFWFWIFVLILNSDTGFWISVWFWMKMPSIGGSNAWYLIFCGLLSQNLLVTCLIDGLYCGSQICYDGKSAFS